MEQPEISKHIPITCSIQPEFSPEAPSSSSVVSFSTKLTDTSPLALQALTSKQTFTMANISINGFGAFFIIVAIVALLAAGGWIVHTHLRARRLGLPRPTIASYNPFKSSGRGGASSGGIGGWFTSKFNAVKNRNKRSAGGAYEEPLSSNVRGGRNHGHGPLDPDDAWDARVGTEADAYGPGGYYEEQELGLGRGGPAGGSTAYGEERGRSRSREPEPYIGGSQAGFDRRYDEEMGRRPQNPFDDAAEVSGEGLRGVSPRPVEMGPGKGKGQDSPTERRSLFRENM